MHQAYLRYAICISVSISMGLAQQNPPARNLSFYLNVEVTDRDGKPVSDLQEQDFTLLDNKRPQKIVSFQAVRGGNQAPPTEVILLTDEVNTPLTTVAFERQELQKFLERDNGVLSHPMSLALLSDAGLKLSKPSQDGRTLIADLAANPAGLRVINSSQGVYGAADRLQRSLNAISQLIQAEGPKAARKLVVWISPGWAVLTGPAIQLSPKDRQGVFRNIVALSENLRNADITISSIDPLGASDSVLRTSFYTGFLKGVKKPVTRSSGIWHCRFSPPSREAAFSVPRTMWRIKSPPRFRTWTFITC